MHLTREQPLPVSPSVAWTALTDVGTLKACIPGCESLRAVSDSEYAVTVVAWIGPIRAKFNGTLEVRRRDQLDPPERYTIHFDGHGGLAGRTRGEADIELRPRPDGGTRLRYAVKASVAGRIALLGAPLVDMAALDLAGTFFTRFNQRMSRPGTRELNSH